MPPKLVPPRPSTPRSRNADAEWFFSLFFDVPIININVNAIAAKRGINNTALRQRLNQMVKRYPGFSVRATTQGSLQSGSLATQQTPKQSVDAGVKVTETPAAKSKRTRRGRRKKGRGNDAEADGVEEPEEAEQTEEPGRRMTRVSNCVSEKGDESSGDDEIGELKAAKVEERQLVSANGFVKPGSVNGRPEAASVQQARAESSRIEEVGFPKNASKAVSNGDEEIDESSDCDDESKEVKELSTRMSSSSRDISNNHPDTSRERIGGDPVATAEKSTNAPQDSMQNSLDAYDQYTHENGDGAGIQALIEVDGESSMTVNGAHECWEALGAKTEVADTFEKKPMFTDQLVAEISEPSLTGSKRKRSPSPPALSPITVMDENDVKEHLEPNDWNIDDVDSEQSIEPGQFMVPSMSLPAKKQKITHQELNENGYANESVFTLLQIPEAADVSGSDVRPTVAFIQEQGDALDATRNLKDTRVQTSQESFVNVPTEIVKDGHKVTQDMSSEGSDEFVQNSETEPKSHARCLSEESAAMRCCTDCQQVTFAFQEYQEHDSKCGSQTPKINNTHLDSQCTDMADVGLGFSEQAVINQGVQAGMTKDATEDNSPEVIQPQKWFSSDLGWLSYNRAAMPARNPGLGRVLTDEEVRDRKERGEL